ncbi:uncharacterized protein LOC119381886 [Rhipicephalus sanguineus]|uniref:uncharacterized protein LOC119381886 n=1 Tax=Rhipicephalus sanguineus TaxID=34632 RepID=UPI001893342F|nr:uncharacterized protein LOC119381886 [Rhipicephalus sanguineus]
MTFQMRTYFLTTPPYMCKLALFSFIIFTATGDLEIFAEARKLNNQIDEAPQASIPSVSARDDSISERGLWGFSFKVPFLCHLGRNECELKSDCPEDRQSWIFGCGKGYVCCKPGHEVEVTRAEKLESFHRAEETSDSERELEHTRDEKRDIAPGAEDTADSEPELETTLAEEREVSPGAEATTALQIDDIRAEKRESYQGAEDSTAGLESWSPPVAIEGDAFMWTEDLRRAPP